MEKQKKLKIYLLTQTHIRGYDTYDSAVVCAYSKSEARAIIPNGYEFSIGRSWPTPEFVKVKKLGVAKEGVDPGVILASYNAG